MENGQPCKCKRNWFIVLAIIIVIGIIWFILRTTCCAAGTGTSCPSVKNGTPAKACCEQLKDSDFTDKVSEGVVIIQCWSSEDTKNDAQTPDIDIAEIIEMLPDGVSIMQVDIAEAGNTAGKLDVKKVPTWIKFKDGKEVKRITGHLNREELKKFICDGEKMVKDAAKKGDEAIHKGAEKVKKEIQKL